MNSRLDSLLLTLAALTGAVPVARADVALKAQSAPAPAAGLSALSAQLIDDYDLASGVLSIPLVQDGARFYRDVRITIRRIDSIGVTSNTSGVFDRYDPVADRLTVPVARAGDQAYYNVVVAPADVLTVGGEVTSLSNDVPLDSGGLLPDQGRRCGF